MASFTAGTPSYNKCPATVTLSSTWNATNYTRLVFSTGTTTNGSGTPPSGIVDSWYPASHSLSDDIEPLIPDTYYALVCYANTPADGGKYWYINGQGFTTADTPEPDQPSLTSETDRYEGGFTVETDDNTDGCDYFRFRLKKDGGTYVYASQSSKYFIKAAGSLDYGQKYWVGALSVYDGEYSDYTSNAACTTRAKHPTLTEYSKTATSIKVKASGLEDTWDKCYINIYNSAGTLIDGSKYVTANNGIIEFTGLSGDTTYKFKGRTWVGTNSVLCSDLVPSTFLSITTPTGKPTDFSWAASTISSDSDARIAASDWNGLANKINEFRAYKGLSSSSFTTVYAGNDIYASQFNELRNSIANMRTTGLADAKSSGNTVYASDIDSLRTTLNAIT